MRQGPGQSDEALQLYHEALQQAEGWHKTAVKKGAATGSEPDAHMAYLLARLYVNGPEPAPQKALQVLQGFESRYPVTRQRDLLYGLVKKLRLKCFLQLRRLDDAEREISSIAAKGPADQETLACINEYADQYYRQARDARAQGDTALAAEKAQAALAVYKKLGSIVAADAKGKNLYDHLQMRLAELYADTDQPQQAEAIYRKKLEQDPASAEAMNGLGLILEKQEQWQDAFDTWQKFSKGLKQGTPPWFEARYRAAWSLTQLGKQSDACEVIAATQIRFQDFGGGEYGRKFAQLKDTVCGVEKGKKAKGTEAPLDYARGRQKKNPAQ